MTALAKRLLIALLVMVGLSQLTAGCFSFRMSQEDVEKSFAGRALKPVFHDIRAGDRTIHYAEIGPDSLPVAFFVHGSPGSWSAWVDFFKDDTLLRVVKMVAVDRPGFGNSSGFGRGEPSLEKQAAYLKPVVEAVKKPGRKLILVGHSLGGPLIARMAMDYPALIDGLVFVAASNDPDLEPREWYRKPGDFFLIRWLLPKSLRASNHEIIGLKPELERMVPRWQTIQQPSIVIQGENDVLVDPGNAEFRNVLVNAPVELVLVPGMNHFVPWSHPHLIRAAILRQVGAKK
jgi:pimeloyl-ACP methyl ester carboxylesterase